MATVQEIKDGYTSTLQDLTCNSKPLISVLTMLAEENISHAKEIVEAIEAHLEKVRTEVKLPVLYLIDCIIKNVGGPYTSAFCTNIVSLFCNVFQVVDEKTRTEMYKLRQTWNDVLPKIKLYALDVQIKQKDPAWPITAAPPKHIHFNPKFLKTGTQIGKKETVISINSTTKPTLVADPATLDMQQKLILKQKQLLELQQKKLELEVLQAQVKLQEQQLLKKGGVVEESTKAKNLLLKPEVAKQLLEETGEVKTKTIPPLRPPTVNNNAPAVGLPKIAPVNSALVAAVRPIRDPRLLRQQQHNQQNTVNSNQQLDNNKPNNNTTINALDSKLVNNKASARVEAARFLNNKDEPKTKTVSSRIPLKSKRPSSPNVCTNNNNKASNKPNRSSSSSNNKSPSSSGSSSTSSLLDSPSKSKNNRSSSKSPSKYKKGSSASTGASSSSSRSDGKKSGGNKANSGGKERKSSPIKDNSGFKSIKGLSKSRNYVRRNRDASPSPEPIDDHHDVDLRVNSGPPPEKQARVQLDEKSEKCDVSIQGMDVDLRLGTELGKKRQSLDSPDVPAKKTKSEMFDVLFGNEDVDLRQLPTITSPKEVERPPTPPPPIISNKTPPKTKAKNEKENSATSSPKNDSSPKANLDALRVKLANATNQDKINKSRFSQPEPKWQPPENITTKDITKPPSLDDSLSKIIISPADEECIKTGKMTKAQENALMNKILAQIENQKLKEAKRKDSEENLANISLQPISDDELDSDMNDSVEIIENKNEVIHIVDDYHPPRQPNFEQRFRRGGGNMPPMWRGNRRGMYPMPRGPMRPPRPGVEPWIRPLPPMNQHWRPPFNNLNNFEDDRIHTIDLVDNRSNSPFPPPTETPDLVVNKENTKSITIDGQPRDIIFYDETAIAFMSWENPREITFQNGSRRVFFDDKDSYVLFFNEPYKDVMINGNLHKVRLGAPTREIYIDGKYYECFFGGNGVAIELDGKQTIVKMEGPPPQVKIGNVKCTHLCAGKINLIIDAKTIVPVYLDAREQKFDIDGKVHTLKFTDALKTVLINGNPFKVEFGGLPKPFTVNDKKHFVRFSVLPRDIKPGFVDIKDMEGQKPPICSDNENSQDAFETTSSGDVEVIAPAVPAPPKRKSKFSEATSSPDRNSNSPNGIQNLLQQPTIGNLDSILTNVLAATQACNLNQSSYQIDNTEAQQQQPEQVSTVAQTTGTNSEDFNINDLFRKLVATGIVSSEGKSTIPVVPPIILPETSVPPPIIIPPPVIAEPQVPEVPKPKKLDLALKYVDFSKPNTLKMRQPALINALYSGMQCSSCGMRFPPENSLLYSQHLDWHFRQNRRGKKSIRKATSRRWYYSISDWNNYEEIEDLEEREKCYFENQQKEQADGVNEEGEEEIEIPSVPADSSVPDPHCEVCQEKFEQFYNEEREEWHLRMAVRIEDRTYHPLCYEDYQASLVDVTMEESINQPETEPNVIPGLEIIPDDNDESKKEDDETLEIIIDDVESIQSVDTPKTESAEKGDNPEVPIDDDDDDVIINEVQPERIILDEYEFKGNVDEDGDLITTEVTIKQEPTDDGFTDIENFKIGEVKIKTEPVTPVDESFEDIGQVVIPDVDEIEEEAPSVEPPHPELVTSIDGNVELNAGGPPPSCGGLGGKIKINISKQLPQLPVIAPKENKDISLDVDANIEPVDPTQPLPPGEEPVQLNIKPALQGVELKKLPPVNKGSELTGLCSIM